MQKSDYKSLYEHIYTTDYESHKKFMGNITITHRCYKEGPLNKSHEIKVSFFQVFGFPISLLIALMFLQ